MVDKTIYSFVFGVFYHSNKLENYCNNTTVIAADWNCEYQTLSIS